jgi:hypothetical protein
MAVEDELGEVDPDVAPATGEYVVRAVAVAEWRCNRMLWRRASWRSLMRSIPMSAAGRQSGASAGSSRPGIDLS